jgi:hypothetical protein
MPVVPLLYEEPIPVPVPPICVECVAPDGHHYVTTEALCKVAGGTPLGKPFPCEDGQAVMQRIKEQGLDQPTVATVD